MSVHAKILKVSHELDEALKRIAVPDYETPATIHEVNYADQFSARIVMAAFGGNIPHDYSAGKFSDAQLTAQLPNFEGALKLAEALKKEGVTLPVRGTLLERIEAVVRTWLRERRIEKARKLAEIEKAAREIRAPSSH